MKKIFSLLIVGVVGLFLLGNVFALAAQDNEQISICHKDLKGNTFCEKTAAAITDVQTAIEQENEIEKEAGKTYISAEAITDVASGDAAVTEVDTYNPEQDVSAPENDVEIEEDTEDDDKKVAIVQESIVKEPYEYKALTDYYGKLCNRADVTNDFVVNALDLSKVRFSYQNGGCTPSNNWCAETDQNFDGSVDTLDSAIVYGWIGKTCPGSDVYKSESIVSVPYKELTDYKNKIKWQKDSLESGRAALSDAADKINSVCKADEESYTCNEAREEARTKALDHLEKSVETMREIADRLLERGLESEAENTADVTNDIGDFLEELDLFNEQIDALKESEEITKEEIQDLAISISDSWKEFKQKDYGNRFDASKLSQITNRLFAVSEVLGKNGIDVDELMIGLDAVNEALTAEDFAGAKENLQEAIELLKTILSEHRSEVSTFASEIGKMEKPAVTI